MTTSVCAVQEPDGAEKCEQRGEMPFRRNLRQSRSRLRGSAHQFWPANQPPERDMESRAKVERDIRNASWTQTRESALSGQRLWPLG